MLRQPAFHLFMRIGVAHGADLVREMKRRRALVGEDQAAAEEADPAKSASRSLVGRRLVGWRRAAEEARWVDEGGGPVEDKDGNRGRSRWTRRIWRGRTGSVPGQRWI